MIVNRIFQRHAIVSAYHRSPPNHDKVRRSANDTPPTRWSRQVRDIQRHGRSRESADTRRRRRRRVAPRHIFHGEPTDDHAVCIFPFRRYEVCGMILYAKSSLELIVNNRIGKVGIRPDGRPLSASLRSRRRRRGTTPRFTPSPSTPAARWPSPSLPPSATHLI